MHHLRACLTAALCAIFLLAAPAHAQSTPASGAAAPMRRHYAPSRVRYRKSVASSR